MQKTLVVIPVYGAWDYLEQCLKSIKRYTLPQHYDVVMVINPSPEDAQLAQKCHAPTPSHAYVKVASILPIDDIDVTVIEQPANIGVAPSWNKGIAHAVRSDQNYDSVLFMNTDVVVFDQWLAMLRLVANRFDPLCVQPSLTEGGQPNMNVMAKIKASRPDLMNFDEVAPSAQGINGPCFMLTRKCIEEVGSFDENYRIGFYEDADYLMRLREHGTSPRTCALSYVHHYHAKSRTSLPNWNAIKLANRMYFERKHALVLPGDLDAKSFPSRAALVEKFGFPVS